MFASQIKVLGGPHVARGPDVAQICRQFHQRFTLAKFWRQKITKPNVTKEIRFRMKDTRVKR